MGISQFRKFSELWASFLGIGRNSLHLPESPMPRLDCDLGRVGAQVFGARQNAEKLPESRLLTLLFPSLFSPFASTPLGRTRNWCILAPWQCPDSCPAFSLPSPLFFSLFFSFLFFSFMWHVKVPRPGIESKLQLQPVILLAHCTRPGI